VTWLALVGLWLFGACCGALAVAWWAAREIGEARRVLDLLADLVDRTKPNTCSWSTLGVRSSPSGTSFSSAQRR
jgi:hypothetical protein